MFHRGPVWGLVTSTPLRHRWTLQHRHVSTDQHATPPLVTPPPPTQTPQTPVVPIPPPSQLSSGPSSTLPPPPPPLPPTPFPLPPRQGSQPPRLADRIPEEYWKRLDEWKDSVDKKAKELAVGAGKNLAIVGLKVNEATGYREVERLKLAVKHRGALRVMGFVYVCSLTPWNRTGAQLATYRGQGCQGRIRGGSV